MTPSDHSEALPSRRELRRRREQQAEDTGTTPLVESEPESTEAPESSRARRAANSPVDAPSTTASQNVIAGADHPRRRSRRADVGVTSHPKDARMATSSIPIVSAEEEPVPAADPVAADGQVAGERPLTRRELRERRRHDVTGESELRETAEEDSQASDSAMEASPVWDESGVTSTQSFKVAMGISDTGMLNSIDAEREAIAREAAALNQKIQEHGASNPHDIDPELLREQQALAERARALAERNESENFDDADFAPAGDQAPSEPAPESVPAPVEEAPAEEPAPEPELTSSAPRRRSDVEQTRSTSATAERSEAPSNEPIGAQTAHGLDPLDTREWTSRERTYMMVSAIVFAIGIITLIIGVILMSR
ncbi:hypothetical protein [Citricoccus sp. NR2]|uniref:hypothetical protein n=1 Tax=Citricoccus sp. NR2 TaxID=3004095 RepID=UPI0022DE1F04|nr:hypothetical protein [Citricoccus sp. NR2]WBL18404.1 hypothetical protein O1A05_11575 [Citricoccus sp. NR2]